MLIAESCRQLWSAVRDCCTGDSIRPSISYVCVHDDGAHSRYHFTDADHDMATTDLTSDYAYMFWRWLW